MVFPPPLIVGGGTFSEQYNSDPESLPISEILRYAFTNGVNAIDTSPYYGDSEILIGKALKELSDEFPRESYSICTKVGRISLDSFDYSKEHVEFSVRRSCERLNTTYLDLVYLHDVEFVPLEDTLIALRELRRLKDIGLIKRFGLSGYPVHYLYEVTRKCATEYVDDIGPLDAILSYCNLNLQNVVLDNYYDKLKNECKIGIISNASILSMSLLREQETVAFHPCSKELRDCADKAADHCQSKGMKLSDLATRYAVSKWIGKGPTVIGVSSVEEMATAIRNYKKIEERLPNNKLTDEETEMVKEIQESIFGSHFNETWSSGLISGSDTHKPSV
ncbi:D-arabinose 1-dehydrogenase (NAD(P)(+)) ARA2 NDAI_0B01300 [Naumovozyma dairenensis CBS 421]|uniref:NADP-dependent oxidoreductase domain-containing protein n=1 Tax=Naumovozyma dairenensis (strain ATCC 10597 / BCRC 20456 / CBS 421 / NBRC 0211 / NRRL Y-12639) TaxID=1071378 RepID=G0W5V3_NAUDC|nr:hypothetical protein NDAI_0B01300 [Naumovozyma dairenensis CBS 421]CCD23164.1 hypothetical protein NDAI_0B01300 [Naumovozyma dairenensis CBS 421]